MKEFFFNSFDGTPLYMTIWDDVNEPKGVIQLCHGMSEYAGHYDKFAKFLNQEGYIVVADDHRAHGRSEDDNNRGNHKGNIFDKTVHDMIYIRACLKNQYYPLPIFFLGHSYGSFLGQAFAQAGTDVKAIALLGTGYQKGLFTLGKIALAPVCLVARNWRPKLVNKISDNFFKYKGDEGKLQWVNSKKECRENFLNGKYTHTDMSIGFDYYMMKGTSQLYSKKALSKLNPTTAIGIFCGKDDPIGNYSKSATKLYKMYVDNGIKAELNLYDGARHEVIYDVSEEQACKDIAKFFNKFIIYKQTTIDDLLR